MNLDASQLSQGLIYLLMLIACIGVHEWAHAWSADKLGDPTPRSQGRVTLNPLAHIDPIGTLLIPALNIFVFSGFSMIGWGKPVYTNPSHYRNRVRGDILVSMAGPFSNLLLALLATLAIALFQRNGVDGTELLLRFLTLNVGLAVFNLLPIPPLDGGHVLRHAVGMSEETYLKISAWSGWVFLLLINLPFFQKFLGTLIGLALQPYLLLLRGLLGA